MGREYKMIDKLTKLLGKEFEMMYFMEHDHIRIKNGKFNRIYPNEALHNLGYVGFSELVKNDYEGLIQLECDVNLNDDVNQSMEILDENIREIIERPDERKRERGSFLEYEKKKKFAENLSKDQLVDIWLEYEATINGIVDEINVYFEEEE